MINLLYTICFDNNFIIIIFIFTIDALPHTVLMTMKLHAQLSFYIVSQSKYAYFETSIRNSNARYKLPWGRRNRSSSRCACATSRACSRCRSRAGSRRSANAAAACLPRSSTPSTPSPPHGAPHPSASASARPQLRKVSLLDVLNVYRSCYFNYLHLIR